MSKPALNLERFARLSAQIGLSGTRDEMLAREGIALEAWLATQEFWMQRMAQEAQRNRFALTQRYSSLYARERREAAERLAAAAKAPAPPPLPRARVAHVIPMSAPRVAEPAPHERPDAAPPPPPPSSARAVVPPPVHAAPPAPPPSVAPPARYVARLSLDQFAALRAELTVTEDAEHPRVRERFGLDDASWRAEEVHWQGKLADKAVFATYLQRFQYFRALLRPPSPIG